LELCLLAGGILKERTTVKLTPNQKIEAVKAHIENLVAGGGITKHQDEYLKILEMLS
jgi:hypothetical protein